MIIGFKAWYADGSKFTGTSFSDWKKLPADGFLIAMLYEDQFSTLTCRGCLRNGEAPAESHRAHFFTANPTAPRGLEIKRKHIANQPWNPDRKCHFCDEVMDYDRGIRYRAILQGGEIYFMTPEGVYGAQNEQPGKSTEDLVADVRARYPNASIKRGKWAETGQFKAVIDEAMQDFNVTQFGVQPVHGTTDE